MRTNKKNSENTNNDVFVFSPSDKPARSWVVKGDVPAKEMGELDIGHSKRKRGAKAVDGDSDLVSLPYAAATTVVSNAVDKQTLTRNKRKGSGRN